MAKCYIDPKTSYRIISALMNVPYVGKVSIEDIARRAERDEECVYDALNFIYLAQKVAPKISMENGEFRIEDYPEKFKQLPERDQFISALFMNRAFDADSAKSFDDLHLDIALDSIRDIISDHTYVISHEDDGTGKFYLSTRGKFRAQGAMTTMFPVIETYTEYKKKNLKPS